MVAIRCPARFISAGISSHSVSNPMASKPSLKTAPTSRTPLRFKLPLLIFTTRSKNSMASGVLVLTIVLIFFSVLLNPWAATDSVRDRNKINAGAKAFIENDSILFALNYKIYCYGYLFM